mmetsp:Transcript_12752/g.19105  ORF Transcript_12752/g.19105 Transcript_12752/m.19105 type:complete len:214 (-) Transcript_12752:1722-2363(-)
MSIQPTNSFELIFISYGFSNTRWQGSVACLHISTISSTFLSQHTVSLTEYIFHPGSTLCSSIAPSTELTSKNLVLPILSWPMVNPKGFASITTLTCLKGRDSFRVIEYQNKKELTIMNFLLSELSFRPPYIRCTFFNPLNRSILLTLPSPSMSKNMKTSFARCVLDPYLRICVSQTKLSKFICRVPDTSTILNIWDMNPESSPDSLHFRLSFG